MNLPPPSRRTRLLDRVQQRSGDVGTIATAEDSAAVDRRWSGLLVRVLARQQVRAVYQPIVQLADRTIVAHEAFARPAGIADDGSVVGLFSSAADMGIGRDLDWLCRRAALDGIRRLPGGGALFVNVDVAGRVGAEVDLDIDVTGELLGSAGVRADEVVFEIPMPLAGTDLDAYVGVTRRYQSCGYRIAVAEVDEACAPLADLGDFTPEFVKLSRTIASTVDRPMGRTIVEAAVVFAHSRATRVVAEGIESADVAAVLAELGVELGQGYHFGRPAHLGDASLH